MKVLTIIAHTAIYSFSNSATLFIKMKYKVEKPSEKYLLGFLLTALIMIGYVHTSYAQSFYSIGYTKSNGDYISPCGSSVVQGKECYYRVYATPIQDYVLTNGGSEIEENQTLNKSLYRKFWSYSQELCLREFGGPCDQTQYVTVYPPVGPVTLTQTSPSSNLSMCQTVPTTSYSASAANANYYTTNLNPWNSGTVSGTGGSYTISWDQNFSGNATFTVTAHTNASGDIPQSSSLVINRIARATFTATINGPTLLCENSQNITYTLTNSGVGGSLSYHFYRNNILVQNSTSNTYVLPNFAQGDQLYGIIFTTNCYWAATSNVLTLNTDVTTPPTVSLQCNNGVPELLKENDPNVYWQTSEWGTSTGDAALKKVNPSPGSYFLRRQGFGGCWSAATTYVVETATPGTVGSVAEFANKGLTLELTGHNTNNTIVRWQKRVGSGLWYDIDHDSTRYTFPGLQETTDFRALMTVNNGCTTFPSNPGTVTIYDAPEVLAIGASGLPYGGGGQVILTTQAFDTWQWYHKPPGGSEVPVGGNSQNFTANALGEYKVQVTKNGKLTTSTSINIGSLGEQFGTNVVSNTRIRIPGVTESTDLFSLTRSQLSQSVKYDDGLGRTAQRVAVGQTPGGNDMVQATAYDKFGRASKQFMPFATSEVNGGFRPNALASGGVYTSGEQYLFYQNESKVAHDTIPYAQSVFDDSPLQRLLEQGAPGADWRIGSNHTIKNSFRLNTTADNVRIWTTAGPNTAVPTTYAANELGVSKTTDENGNEVIQFADKLGRLILKRVQVGETIEGTYTEYLDTYYVYDIRGNLSMQVPPKAVAKINASTTWSTAFRDEWCFVYTYDDRNRLVEKKVPGAGLTYLIYDRLDRVVLVQDAEMRLTNKWLFVKYDARQRPIMQGTYINSTHTTRTAVQTNVADVLYTNTADPYFEMRGTTLHGYTNLSFPTQNSDASPLEVLSVNYYDNYDFDQNGSPDYSYTAQGLPNEGTQASSFGLPTGGKKIVIGTSNWLYKYIFYDKYNRPIQVRSNNHLSATLDNLATTTYDFEGKALQTVEYHNGGGTNQTSTITRMDYDFASRPLRTIHQINGAPEVVATAYQYNELGQLVEKNLHCTDCNDPALSQPGATVGVSLQRTAYSTSEQALVATESITLSPGFEVLSGSDFSAKVVSPVATVPPSGGNYLQSIDYRYNIRGWVSSINNASLTDDGTTNDDTGDYFGMEFAYNTVDAGLGNAAYYNGNISAVKWKSPFESSGAEGQQSYKYNYDKSDKLKQGVYSKRGIAAWDQDSDGFNESMTYDHNGNMMSMQRKMVKRTLQNDFSIVSTTQMMDDLAYSYASGEGNRLTSVEDTGMEDGFKNGASTSTEYNYNNNGSMVSDANKGIDSTAYNVLGKPEIVWLSNGQRLEYTYDGAGNKLTLELYQADTLAKTTDYLGGHMYSNGTLAYMASPGGRAVKNGNNFEYQYAITDNQGNTRVLFGTKAPAPDTYTATFETGTQAAEQADFQNYPTGAWHSSVNLYDHTDAGTTYTYSQLLNGASNGQVGLTKTLKVFPGDTIKAEVYAKYFNNTSTTSNLAGFASALTAAFGLSAGSSGEMLKAFTGLNDFGSVVVANNGSGSSGGPKAFITILQFDQNFNFVDVAFDQIDPGAMETGSGVAHDLLSSEVVIKEAGYVYIYISNENPTLVDVYFDDLKITQTKTGVLQYNEYYPFGMQTINSWTREDTNNNFLYNSGTELNGTTGLYDLAFRNYDPVLGRFVQVDPLADLYEGLTPYNYANNDPVYYNDPSGLAGEAGPSRPNDPWEEDHDYPNVGVIFEMNQGGGAYGASFDSNWRHIPTGLDQQRLADQARNGDQEALQEYTERYANTIYSSGTNVENSIWNPWDGDEVKDGKYSGGWVPFSWHLIRKIVREEYEISTKFTKIDRLYPAPDYGFGLSINIGWGFWKGSEVTFGGWSGGPGSKGQGFITFGSAESWYLNASVSSHLLFMRSRSGEIDVTGDGRAWGLGYSKLSGSYSQGVNQFGDITSDAVSVGPSLGLKYTGGLGEGGKGIKSNTWSIDFWSPIMITPLLGWPGN